MAENRIRILAVLDDKVSKSLDKIRDKLDTLGGKGTGAVAFGTLAAKGMEKITSAAKDAAGAVIDFGVDSVKAASSLQQSTGAIESVFGSASDKIKKFGETAADSVGLSKNAVNEMAAVVGAQLQGMGFAYDKAADKTIELEKRAADLAATFGGTTKDAIQAISALLRGERDPIERYGVSIKAADVKARILALGLDTSTAAMLKNAEAVAGLELLMESTAKTTGQFSREMDSLAGASQRADARLENLQAQLGEKMVPVAAAVTEAVIELLTAIQALGDATSGKFTPEAIAYNVAMNGTKLAAEDVARNLAVVTNEGLSTALALGLLTTAQVEAERAARGLSASGEDLGGKISNLEERFPGAGKAADDLAGDIKGVGDKAKDAADRVHTSLAKIVSDVKGARSALEGAAEDAASAIYDPLIAKAELAATERELAEQKQTAASKSSTKEQVADAKLRILELNKTRIQQMATLASYGDQSAAAALQHQLRVLESTKNLTTEQKEQIRLLRAALASLKNSYDAARIAAERLATARIDGALDRPGTAPKPRAHGGPVKRGEAYIVGEKQAEVFVPDRDGTIIPQVSSTSYMLPQAQSSTAGPTVIFQSTWPPTPAQARQIAEAVAEELDRIARRTPVRAA